MQREKFINGLNSGIKFTDAERNEIVKKAVEHRGIETTLANIYRQRKNHKLDEWREFCKWIESLLYSEMITGKEDSDNE